MTRLLGMAFALGMLAVMPTMAQVVPFPSTLQGRIPSPLPPSAPPPTINGPLGRSPSPVTRDQESQRFEAIAFDPRARCSRRGSTRPVIAAWDRSFAQEFDKAAQSEPVMRPLIASASVFALPTGK
jgi:hypothetical protein